MFDPERLVEECLAVQEKGDVQSAIREILARELSDPAAVLKGLGEPFQQV